MTLPSAAIVLTPPALLWEVCGAELCFPAQSPALLPSGGQDLHRRAANAPPTGVSGGDQISCVQSLGG